jgi:hypothetical protein
LQETPESSVLVSIKPWPPTKHRLYDSTQTCAIIQPFFNRISQSGLAPAIEYLHLVLSTHCPVGNIN